VRTFKLLSDFFCPREGAESVEPKRGSSRRSVGGGRGRREEGSSLVSVLEKGVAGKKLRVDPYAARLAGVYYLSIIEY